LVSRENAGDVDGMIALYEPKLSWTPGKGNWFVVEKESREFYSQLVAAGRKFEMGEQRAAMVSKELALTSTILPDGTVTAEVARRQNDGTWLWVIDRFSISSQPIVRRVKS
jgi:hypothetical protein